MGVIDGFVVGRVVTTDAGVGRVVAFAAACDCADDEHREAGN